MKTSSPLIRKILVVNVNWLGDVIFSVPVFRALKQHYPQAEVWCLAVPRVREVLESCPFVDGIIVYDERGRDRGLLAKWRLVRRLRAADIDLAFVLHRSWTRAFLVFLAGIPQRVGVNVKGRGGFLTCRVVPPPENLHRADAYLAVLEGYGVPVTNRRYELLVEPAAMAAVNRKLSSAGITAQDKMVVVNPGGNWNLKRWPPEFFAQLIRRLVSELKVKVVLPGGVADRDMIVDIARNSAVDPLLLVGQTNLKELVALMRQATLVISADSGPLHVASAVGTCGIGIFGPTRPELTGPRGPGEVVILQKDVGCNRSACYNLACPDNVCMKAVTVEEVVAAAKKMLSRR